MIKAHKIATLQTIGQSAFNMFDSFNSVNEKLYPTDEELETADMLAGSLLEKLALWRTNYAHHFRTNEGVKIRE